MSVRLLGLLGGVLLVGGHLAIMVLGAKYGLVGFVLALGLIALGGLALSVD